MLTLCGLLACVRVSSATIAPCPLVILIQSQCSRPRHACPPQIPPARLRGLGSAHAFTTQPSRRARIYVSGVTASFGLNAGLLFLPALVDTPAPRQPEPTSALAFSPSWMMLAIIVAGAFIFVLGPGIRLSR